jgi:hypothetical protein
MSKKRNKGNNVLPNNQSEVDYYNLKLNFAKVRNNQSTNAYSKSSYQSDKNHDNGLHTQSIPINYDYPRTRNSIPDTNKNQNNPTSEMYEVNNRTIENLTEKIEKKLDTGNFKLFLGIAAFFISGIVALFLNYSYSPYLSKVDNNKNQIDTLTRKIDNIT